MPLFMKLGMSGNDYLHNNILHLIYLHLYHIFIYLLLIHISLLFVHAFSKYQSLLYYIQLV